MPFAGHQSFEASSNGEMHLTYALAKRWQSSQRIVSAVRECIVYRPTPGLRDRNATLCMVTGKPSRYSVPAGTSGEDNSERQTLKFLNPPVDPTIHPSGGGRSKRPPGALLLTSK